jgi:release factor glutamine methyltransferase
VTARLAAAGCVAAPDEAAELWATGHRGDGLEALVRRRERGEPLAWLTGTCTFGDLRLMVLPGVFVPRPHTVELATRAAAVLPAQGTAVDLCTGCGAVASHLRASAPGATVVGIDLDPLAAACARRNGVPTVVADLDGPLRDACADVLTAVAPYVPTAELAVLPRDVTAHEPRTALDGGFDGLAVVARVVAAAARLLRPGGHLLLELGGDQEGPVAALLAAAGLDEHTRWHDDDGDLRGLHARRARRAH